MMEEEKQRKRMETIYESMVKKLSEAERSDLRYVQQIWLQWLEAKCSFVNRVPGAGSEANVEAALCRVQTTSERAEELERLQSSFMLNYGYKPP